jgi:hypothetical protein
MEDAAARDRDGAGPRPPAADRLYIYMSCFPPINLKHPSAVAGAFRTRVPGIMRETAMYNGCNVSGRVEPSQIGLRAAGLFY